MPPNLDAMQVQFVRGGGSQWHPSFRLDQDWFRKNLVDFDFWYIYYGEGYLRDQEDHTFTLRQGTCLFMKPGSVFEVWRKPGSKFSTRYFHFNLLDAQGQMVSPAQIDIPLLGDMSAHTHVDSLTRRMSDLIALDVQTSEQQLIDQSHQTISIMLKALLMDYILASSMRQVYSLHGVEETHYKMALNLVSQIHENPAGFDLQYYTNRVKYTPDHLRRMVKRVVGKTPHQLIIEAKIKRAKFLLHESDIGVSEIADQLGYANVHYFSLQFKQITGLSPTQFRQRERAATAERASSMGATGQS